MLLQSESHQGEEFGTPHSKGAQSSIFGPEYIHLPMFDLIIIYRPKYKKISNNCQETTLLNLYGRMSAMFFMLFAWGGEQRVREGGAMNDWVEERKICIFKRIS